MDRRDAQPGVARHVARVGAGGGVVRLARFALTAWQGQGEGQEQGKGKSKVKDKSKVKGTYLGKGASGPCSITSFSSRVISESRARARNSGGFDLSTHCHPFSTEALISS